VTFVRNLLSDLVARRLWPVAVVLLAALVAVPVLLAGDVEAPPAPQASAEPDLGSSPLVSVASDEPIGGHTPIGRNPFAQKRVAPPAEVSTGITPGGGQNPSQGGAGGSTVNVGGGIDVTGGLPALDDVDLVPVGGGGPATPKSDARDSYRVDIRFGKDGSLSARNDVPRLSPLPSADDPFFVFMGVLADGETALFLVSSDAEATGDGTCKPTPANCERVEMQAGETEFFDVTTPDGAVVQYQLDLVRVARVRATSPVAAASARSREDVTGREVLRHAIDTKQVDVANIAYSRDMGVLVPSAAAGAASSGALFGGFRTDLQFGPPGELVKRYNLARLTPLPSVEAPSFLYLGVMGDADDPKALFLNPSEAAVSGDAVCNPTPDECSRIELRPGESGLLDVPTIDGETDEYQIDIDAITELQADTPAEAKRMLERESPAGRIVLRRLITEVGGLVSDLSYSSSKGKLIQAK
jgi:hypothetical protein